MSCVGRYGRGGKKLFLNGKWRPTITGALHPELNDLVREDARTFGCSMSLVINSILAIYYGVDIKESYLDERARVRARKPQKKTKPNGQYHHAVQTYRL